MVNALSLSVAPWMHILTSTYLLIYETYIDRVVHLHSTVLSRYTWRHYHSFSNVIAEAHVRIYSTIISYTICGNEGDCPVNLIYKTVIACVSSLLLVL